MERREKKEYCMKDQRGFTLVELLIGVVILSIVTAAVCSFIVIGSKSYAAANTEIMLQQEAQLALNQISDVIIDTTSSVNYEGASAVLEDGSYSDIMFAEKDADFTFEPQTKILTMYNGTKVYKYDTEGNKIKVLDEEGNPKVDENGEYVYETEIETGNGNQKHYQFIWDKESSKLYYNEIPVAEEEFKAEDQVVLAEYVTEFSIDLSQVVEKRVVQVFMTFEKDNKTYQTSNNITIRNKVQINDKDLEGLNKRVELSVEPKDRVVILEPGETYQFSTPLVSGQNVIDKSVTWEIAADAPPSDDVGTYFMDTANGLIKISSGETGNELSSGGKGFKVIITTNARDFQGNQATATVEVQIKRADHIDMSLDGGSQEITAGTNFTINASVEGNKLGVSCGGCDDATTIDKYVIADEYPAFGWQVTSGAEYVEIVSYDNKSAQFKISANAQDGDTVVIQAASLLSARKEYTKDGGSGIVYGTITLTVEGKDPIHIDWEGDLVYGGSNILNMVGINSDDPVFFVCVRIKKDPTAPVDQDMVMIYTTEGNNARIKPDTWLLNMNQEYVVSVQVINVLSDPSLRDEDMQKTERYDELRSALSAWSGNHDSWAYSYLTNYVESTFWPEYTSKINGTTGGYRGEKYPEYSNLVPGVVQVPRIGIESYLDNNKPHYEGVDAKTIYTVQRHGNPNQLDIPCRIGTITSTWNSAVFQNDAFFNVYKGTGDSSEWKCIYYSPKNDSWPNQQSAYEGIGEIGGKENKNGDGVLLFDGSDLANYVNTKVRVHFFNNKGDKSSNYNYEYKKAAVGTYHYVPAVSYVNQPEGVYLKISDNYEIYDGKQYCYDFTSTFNFEVKDGGNLSLWAYTDEGFKKGEIFFPVPSDPLQFPEQFRNLGEEEVSIYYYDMTYLLSDGKLYEPKFSEIKCRYNASQSRYELKLYYDYTDIYGITKRCCAGTFICESDGNEWRLFNKGDYDEQFEKGKMTLLFGSGITMWALTNSNNFMQGEVYFPAPSEKDSFEKYFKLNDTSLQEVTSKGFKMMLSDQSTQDVQFSRITCQYINNVYEVEFFYQMDVSGWNSKVEKSAGRFRCDANGTKWVRMNPGSVDDQLNAAGQNSVPVNNVQVDGSSASFTMTDYDNSTKAVTAYIPLPSDEAFTKTWNFKLEQDAPQTQAGKLQTKCQVEGRTSFDDFDSYDVICTYDKKKDTYTLELRCECWYDTGTVGWKKLDGNLKLQCKSTDTKWTVVK